MHPIAIVLIDCGRVSKATNGTPSGFFQDPGVAPWNRFD